MQNNKAEAIQSWFDNLIANAKQRSGTPAFEKPFTVISILKTLSECSENDKQTDILRLIISKRCLVESAFKSLIKEAKESRIKTPKDFRTQFNEVLVEHIAVKPHLESALYSLIGSKKTLVLADKMKNKLFFLACKIPSKRLVNLSKVYLEKGQLYVNKEDLQSFEENWMNVLPEGRRNSFYINYILGGDSNTFQIGVYGLLKAKYPLAYSVGRPTQADRSIDREDVVIKNENNEVLKIVSITKDKLKPYLKIKLDKYMSTIHSIMLVTLKANIEKNKLKHEIEKLNLEIISAEYLLENIVEIGKLDLAFTCFFLEYGRRMRSTDFSDVDFDPFKNHL